MAGQGRNYGNGKLGLTMKKWSSSPIEESIQRECAAVVAAELAKPANRNGLDSGDIAQIRLGAREKVLSKLKKKGAIV